MKFLLGLLKTYRLLVVEATGAIAAAMGLRALVGVSEPQFYLAIGTLIALVLLHQYFARPASRIRAVTPVNPDWFEGRDQEVRWLVEQVGASRIVLLRGESGAGKSTLVRLGLIPELERTRIGFGVHVMHWGEHWVDGPLEALADAWARATQHQPPVSPPDIETAIRQLSGVQARRPVLVFDQFDDYQTQHYDRFMRESGIGLSAAELVALNPFWAMVSGLLADGLVRCVFVVRSDSAYGWECTRLHSSFVDKWLGRLPPATAPALLERVVPRAQVDSPEAGWDELSALVCRHLQHDGTLAMRLVLVLRAMESLIGTVIRGGFYRRIGGLPGLESLPMEQRVLEASRRSRLAQRTIIAALRELVDPNDFTKTREVDLGQVASSARLRGIPVEALAAAFAHLDDQDMVRRTARGRWRLHHDYLTHAVAALWFRRGRATQVLEESAGRFRIVRGWEKARALLPPSDWWLVARSRARGDVQLAPHRGFFALSALRLLVPWPALMVLLAAAVWGTQATLERRLQAEKRQATDLFHQLQSDSDPAARLVQLAAMPERARLALLEEIVTDSDDATVLVNSWETYDLSAALFQFDEGTRRQAIQRLQPLCSPDRGDPFGAYAQQQACALLFGSLSDQFHTVVELQSALPPYSALPVYGGLDWSAAAQAALRVEPAEAASAFRHGLKFGFATPQDAFAVLAARMPLDDARDIAGELLAAARDPQRAMLNAIHLASLTARLPSSERARIVADLLAPVDAQMCPDAFRSGTQAGECFPVWNWEPAWAVALAGGSASADEVAAIKRALDNYWSLLQKTPSRRNEITNRCSLFQAPLPFFGDVDSRILVIRTFAAPEYAGCLDMVISAAAPSSDSGLTEPITLARRLSDEERATIYAGLTFIASDAFRSELAASLSDTAAEAAFERELAQLGGTYALSSATMAVLALRMPDASVRAALLAYRRDCQPHWTACAALQFRSGEEPSTAIPSLVRGLRGGVDALRSHLANVPSDTVLQVLMELVPRGSAQATPDCIELLKARLNEADRHAWSRAILAAWTSADEYGKRAFIAADPRFWVEELPADHVDAHRELIANALTGDVIAFGTTEALDAFRQVVPNARERAELVLAALFDPAPGMIPPVAVRDSLAATVVPGTEDIATGYLGKWTNNWRMRTLLAQRVCELHADSCRDEHGPIDVRDRWRFAKWAAGQQITLSVPVSAPTPEPTDTP